MFIVSIIHGYLSNVIATKTVKGEMSSLSKSFLGNSLLYKELILISLGYHKLADCGIKYLRYKIR